VVAYTYDVTILVTAPEDILAIRDAMRCYEKASVAILNFNKSQALAVGAWDTTERVLVLPYSTKIKVLGFRMQNTVAKSVTASWTMITTMVRA
jgi:hypothetical protein